MNAVIAAEIFRMVRASYARLRYFPPSRLNVTIKSLSVFLVMILFSSLIFFQGDALPHETVLIKGSVCLPMHTDRRSLIFFYAFYIPVLFVIPLIVILSITARVLYKNMLPTNGRTRQLATYFFRIIAVFIVMWIPTIFLFFVFPAGNHWVRS